MHAPSHDRPALELALLHRSLGEITASTEHCGRCGRALLIGEHVYEYADGGLACSLCRDRERATPALTRTVHTAASGHSIRVLDRRPRKRSA
jgi:recombinational DNA repair protein (RecF pathway)